MQKYHYSDGTNSFGPFTLEELKEIGIVPDTYIWFEGMTNWKPAKELPELSFLIAQGEKPYYTQAGPPPPHYGQSTPPPYGTLVAQPPPSYLIWAILSTLFCCLPFGIVSIVYASSVERKFYSGDIAGAQRASDAARKWLWINVAVSVAAWIFYLAIFGFAFFTTILGAGAGGVYDAI